MTRYTRAALLSLFLLQHVVEHIPTAMTSTAKCQACSGLSFDHDSISTGAQKDRQDS